MATPPKSPPRKAVTKAVASPVKAVRSTVAPPKSAAPEKPFVIEPESLSDFVGKSDSALPTTNPAAKSEPAAAKVEPIAAKPAPEPVAAKPDAAPAPAAPLKTGAVAAAKSAPVGTRGIKPSVAVPPAETKASPPQPAVAGNTIAATPKAAQWHAPNALEGQTIMNEAIETSKKFAEDAKARLQTLVTDFNEKAKVAVEKSSKTAEELSDIAKGNLEAIVESSKIAAKGLESLGQNAAEYGRQSFEKTSATLKSFASVKSPTEFFQLHSDLFTASFDTLAAQTARNSEAFLKLAGDIAQPISSRYAVVSDKLKTLAA